MKFIKIDPFLSWDRRKVANTDFFCYLPQAESVKMYLMKIQIRKKRNETITDMPWMTGYHVKKTFNR